jgi:hypothetical protein
MELIETLQGEANSIAGAGDKHVPKKSPAKRTSSRGEKPGSQKRRKGALAAGTKPAAITESK